jgi:hypothetical protein
MIFDANHHLFPPTSWEIGAAASTGFTITQFRFVIAFLISIPIAYLFRLVPTTRGMYEIFSPIECDRVALQSEDVVFLT